MAEEDVIVLKNDEDHEVEVVCQGYKIRIDIESQYNHRSRHPALYAEILIKKLTDDDDNYHSVASIYYVPCDETRIVYHIGEGPELDAFAKVQKHFEGGPPWINANCDATIEEINDW